MEKVISVTVFIIAFIFPMFMLFFWIWIKPFLKNKLEEETKSNKIQQERK